jgi:hypothetical protein
MKLVQFRDKIQVFQKIASDFDSGFWSFGLKVFAGSELTKAMRYQCDLADFLDTLDELAVAHAADGVLEPGRLLQQEVNELLEVVTPELVELDKLAALVIYCDFRELGDAWGMADQKTPEMLVNQVLDREITVEQAVALSRESLDLMKHIWTTRTAQVEKALTELTVLELTMTLTPTAAGAER